MQGMGEVLNLILAERNMSSKDLAAELGITVQQLHYILTNQSLSTVPMLQRLSETLNVPSDYLLQDIDKMFLIYAIDDYFELIDKDKLSDIWEKFTSIMKAGEE